MPRLTDPGWLVELHHTYPLIHYIPPQTPPPAPAVHCSYSPSNLSVSSPTATPDAFASAALLLCLLLSLHTTYRAYLPHIFLPLAYLLRYPVHDAPPSTFVSNTAAVCPPSSPEPLYETIVGPPRAAPKPRTRPRRVLRDCQTASACHGQSNPSRTPLRRLGLPPTRSRRHSRPPTCRPQTTPSAPYTGGHQAPRLGACHSLAFLSGPARPPTCSLARPQLRINPPVEVRGGET